MSLRGLVLFFLICVSTVESRALDEESCSCLAASCAPCEVEVGVTFYSAKCGPSLAKVKSCKKPTCQPVEDQKQCLLDAGLSVEESPLASTKSAGRDPASMTTLGSAAIAEPVGKVIFSSGSSLLTRPNTAAISVKAGLEIKQGDRLQTSENGRIKIAFLDKNELNITPKSDIVIEKQEFDAKGGRRNTMINLVYGKIRSKLTQKYDGNQNRYEVKTKASVAGVRGTDFVATFDPSETKWVTQIETFSGKVALFDSRYEKNVEVGAGQVATFTAEDIGAGKHSEYFSPPQEILPSKLKSLDVDTDFSSKDPDAVSNKEESNEYAANHKNSSLCQQPLGDFSQCSYTCENNPSGEKNCRTDLPQVKCVQRTCKANGIWMAPTRLPASKSDLCQGDRPVVRSCEPIW